jgi:hypothetical protein
MILHHHDIRFAKWIKQYGRCEVCDKELSITQPQLAHRMEKSKMNIEKYGIEIIDHPLNLALVCSLKCNQSVLIGMAKTALIEEHVCKIKQAIENT